MTEDDSTLGYRVGRMEADLNSLRREIDSLDDVAHGKISQISEKLTEVATRLSQVEREQARSTEQIHAVESSLGKLKDEVTRALRGVNARITAFAFTIAASAVGIALTIVLSSR